MSTNLPQSPWLDQVARGIEQVCAHQCLCGWNQATGLRTDIVCPYHDKCFNCNGSGKVRPYADTGLAGWLRDKRGSEWPSLCIVERQGHEPYISWQRDGLTADSMPHKVWHILEDTDALALLEEATGGYWERTKAVATGKDIYEWFKQEKQITIANSPGELLDKIIAEEEKHRE